MGGKNSEKGAVMVEAAIYVPLVLCTVMALIYLALFNMQEYMMMYQALEFAKVYPEILMYQVQRVAAVVAREEAYIGYETFGMGADNEIDFNWGHGNYPSEAQISQYYAAHHETVGRMYREVGSFLHAVGIPGANPDGYMGRFGNAAIDASLLAIGTVSRPDIDIDYGLLGTQITVEITHSIPMPGVIRYLGMPDELTMYERAYTYSTNPSSFVRNVDLAFDLTAYIFDKLGMSGRYNDFKSKTSEVLGKIL